MPDSLESLRSELVRRRGETSNTGFPSELRDRVATFVRTVRTTEVTTAALARGLGIARQSLVTWLGENSESRQGKSASTTAVTFLPAVVIPDAPREVTSRIVLNSPRGYRVEGLDVAALVELLGRIG